MNRYSTRILDYNTKDDFISYCKMHWYNKKDIRHILKLLELFIEDSLINKWKLVFSWLFSISIHKTKTTLREWVFNKVKIRLNKNITYLFKNKW